jgi:hypothetical protein
MEKRMAVTVLLDFPRRRIGPGPVQAAATLLGSVLVLIGLIAIVPAFALTIIGGIAAGGETGSGAGADLPSWLPGDFATIWVTAVATAVLALAVGVRLVRGNRRLVLFLRRFGHTAATHAVTVATTSIGARWRMVTLDDAQIAPVGVGAMNEFVSTLDRGHARILRIYAVARGLVLSALFYSFIAALIDIGLAAANGMDVSTLLGRNSGTTAGIVLRVLVIVGAVAVGLVLVAAAFSTVRLLLFPALWVGISTGRAVRAADGAKTLTVADLPAIVTARDRAKRLSRKVFSPRLIVLRVDSSIWQQAVNGVASVAAVPLIDISEPTDNVIWETEQLTARFGPRCVFVGEYPRVAHLETAAPAGSAMQRIQHLLDGRTVLAYTTDDAGTTRFTRALRATLEHSVRTPLVGPPPPDALPRQLVIQARREAMRARRRARRFGGGDHTGLRSSS